MTLREAVEQFLAWCGERRASATCKLYRSRLNSLINCAKDSKGKPFFEDEKPLGDHPLLAISRQMVESWIGQADHWPDGSLKAPDTRRATAISFMQFQKWAKEYDHLANLIVAKLPKPMGRMRKRIPREEETRKLLEKASPEFRLVYQALRQCGARPGELCAATIADWQREQNVIVLAHHKTAEKTGQERRIPVGVAFEKLLLQAIGGRTEGPLFLSATGRPWRPQRLSTIYRRLRNEAGLPKDLVLYLARHEHGTKITKAHGIHAAKENLGHASITTTQRYAHATDSERAAWQDSFQA